MVRLFDKTKRDKKENGKKVKQSRNLNKGTLR